MGYVAYMEYMGCMGYMGSMGCGGAPCGAVLGDRGAGSLWGAREYGVGSVWGAWDGVCGVHGMPCIECMKFVGCMGCDVWGASPEPHCVPLGCAAGSSAPNTEAGTRGAPILSHLAQAFRGGCMSCVGWGPSGTRSSARTPTL